MTLRKGTLIKKEYFHYKDGKEMGITLCRILNHISGGMYNTYIFKTTIPHLTSSVNNERGIMLPNESSIVKWRIISEDELMAELI